MNVTMAMELAEEEGIEVKKVVANDDVVVMISGLGATPYMEQYIAFNEVTKILSDKGIKIHISYIGNYFTFLEMSGITVTLMKLDEELKECMNYEADSVGLRQFQINKA